MIKSMTGYGRKEVNIRDKKFIIEMKSVNHRFLEVTFKMPKELMVLEDSLKKTLQDYVKRGRVDVYITIENNELNPQLQVDWDLAKQYIQMMKEMKDQFQLVGNIELKDVLTIPDLIRSEIEFADMKVWKDEFIESFREACQILFQMREVEGTSLMKDFQSRLKLMGRVLAEIEGNSSLVVNEYREKLMNRINEWLGGTIELDEARLLNEVAFFTDKANIDEEITRLKSHFGQFLVNLGIEEPVGRKLDFLVQEMNREINTIGSKANHLELSQSVVELKSELEKIREQVQNVE
ncbi:YicC/YloC family endoribonuclease [Tepidibacillus marianensis]|uniref:YicC/YloC family endoribonuclease n=1 Tax=Tepidibacillus marianensis TaxID=3131995 RepID=UPI0030CDC5D6